MSEAAGALPWWKQKLRRVYFGYLKARYRDPVQRDAQAHLHPDLTFMDDRIAEFASSRPQVQRQVIRELDQKIEFGKPGNSSPALSGLLTVAGTTATLIGAIYLAIYNGWFNLLAVVTDPKTGRFHGISAAQSMSVVGGISGAIIWWCAAFLIFGLLLFWSARSRDKDRATARVWLDAYKEALAEK